MKLSLTRLFQNILALQRLQILYMFDSYYVRKLLPSKNLNNHIRVYYALLHVRWNYLSYFPAQI